MAGSEEQALRVDGLFEAKVEALHEAQDVAEQGLDVLLQAPAFDREALHRLHEWTHSHAEEADALLVAMVQLEVCEALVG